MACGEDGRGFLEAVVCHPGWEADSCILLGGDSMSRCALAFFISAVTLILLLYLVREISCRQELWTARQRFRGSGDATRPRSAHGLQVPIWKDIRYWRQTSASPYGSKTAQTSVANRKPSNVHKSKLHQLKKDDSQHFGISHEKLNPKHNVEEITQFVSKTPRNIDSKPLMLEKDEIQQPFILEKSKIKQIPNIDNFKTDFSQILQENKANDPQKHMETNYSKTNQVLGNNIINEQISLDFIPTVQRKDKSQHLAIINQSNEGYLPESEQHKEDKIIDKQKILKTGKPRTKSGKIYRHIKIYEEQKYKDILPSVLRIDGSQQRSTSNKVSDGQKPIHHESKINIYHQTDENDLLKKNEFQQLTFLEKSNEGQKQRSFELKNTVIQMPGENKASDLQKKETIQTTKTLEKFSGFIEPNYLELNRKFVQESKDNKLINISEMYENYLPSTHKQPKPHELKRNFAQLPDDDKVGTVQNNNEIIQLVISGNSSNNHESKLEEVKRNVVQKPVENKPADLQKTAEIGQFSIHEKSTASPKPVEMKRVSELQEKKKNVPSAIPEKTTDDQKHATTEINKYVSREKKNSDVQENMKTTQPKYIHAKQSEKFTVYQKIRRSLSHEEKRYVTKQKLSKVDKIRDAQNIPISKEQDSKRSNAVSELSDEIKDVKGFKFEEKEKNPEVFKTSIELNKRSSIRESSESKFIFNDKEKLMKMKQEESLKQKDKESYESEQRWDENMSYLLRVEPSKLRDLSPSVRKKGTKKSPCATFRTSQRYKSRDFLLSGAERQEAVIKRFIRDEWESRTRSKHYHLFDSAIENIIRVPQQKKPESQPRSAIDDQIHEKSVSVRRFGVRDSCENIFK